MADALRQLALAAEALGDGHFVGEGEQLVDDRLHRSHAPYGVAGDDFLELFEAEFHIVEVLDGLAQLYGDVGQHGLEVAEGFAGSLARLGVDGLLRDGVFDEHHQSPRLAVDGGVKFARVGLQGNEGEHLAVDIVLAACLQLLTYVTRDGAYVRHKHLYVGEDVGVDALQDVVGRFGLGGAHE